MATSNGKGYVRQGVTTRTISGHPTGITIPEGQAAYRNARIGSPSQAQSNTLAGAQPNTDRRRFVTHS